MKTPIVCALSSMGVLICAITFALMEVDRRGTVLPLQDIHIAACALEICAVVLTTDQHFSQIPGLTVTNCLY